MIGRILNRVLSRVSKRYERNEGTEQTPRTYTIEDYITSTPYLTRTVFGRIFGVRPLLHKFHRPDNDRALHNHPWKWSLSIILCGSYTEERLDPHTGTTDIRRLRFFNFLTEHDYHRVLELHGNVWTLFFTGPRIQDWGFLTSAGYTPHAEYIAAAKLKHENEVAAAEPCDYCRGKEVYYIDGDPYVCFCVEAGLRRAIAMAERVPR